MNNQYFILKKVFFQIYEADTCYGRTDALFKGIQIMPWAVLD